MSWLFCGSYEPTEREQTTHGELEASRKRIEELEQRNAKLESLLKHSFEYERMLDEAEQEYLEEKYKDDD